MGRSDDTGRKQRKAGEKEIGKKGEKNNQSDTFSKRN